MVRSRKTRVECAQPPFARGAYVMATEGGSFFAAALKIDGSDSK
jgi:hypothetical protein